jgi:hypothetical protein
MTHEPAVNWNPCPPGELKQLTKRLHKRRQRRNFLRTGSIVGVGLAACGAIGVAGVLLYEPSHAGITCARVVALADAYGQGTVDPAEAEKIRNHLPLCPNCRRLYQSRNLVDHDRRCSGKQTV